MYEPTKEQTAAERRLSREGFRFSNWISAQDGIETHGCMVMVRKPSRFRTEMREIDPAGNVN